MTTRGVREFFDDVSEEYRDTPAGMRSHHVLTARTIEGSLSGSVLCVGGLWNQVDLDSLPPRVTVADLSIAMLHQLPAEASGILCEARALPFETGSFDHIVFPLVLHHITEDDGVAARRCVASALAEARRVLVRGGSIWISEFCLNRVIYAAELLFSPLTRVLLSTLDIPLVVMHSAPFFTKTLLAAGFGEIEVKPIRPPETGPLDTIRPIIGLPWLRVPRLLYPVTPTLIRARAGGPGASYLPRKNSRC